MCLKLPAFSCVRGVPGWAWSRLLSNEMEVFLNTQAADSGAGITAAAVPAPPRQHALWRSRQSGLPSPSGEPHLLLVRFVTEALCWEGDIEGSAPDL